MSGGHFDYKQYFIRDVIDTIENFLFLIKKWKKLTDQEKEKHIEDYNSNYSSICYIEDINKFENFLKINLEHLIISYNFIQRLDWFLSGDDGEDTMYERYVEDLYKEAKKYDFSLKGLFKEEIKKLKGE